MEFPSPDSIENDLKALLLKLPLSGLDPCTIWFTRNAILTGKSASQHQRVRERFNGHLSTGESYL